MWQLFPNKEVEFRMLVWKTAQYTLGHTTLYRWLLLVILYKTLQCFVMLEDMKNINMSRILCLQIVDKWFFSHLCRSLLWWYKLNSLLHFMFYFCWAKFYIGIRRHTVLHVFSCMTSSLLWWSYRGLDTCTWLFSSYSLPWRTTSWSVWTLHLIVRFVSVFS